MQGDICSLAGLELSYKKQNTSICLENWTYKKQLTTHDVVVLTFWDTSLASFDLNCFAWCSTRSKELQMTTDDYRILHINTNDSLADICREESCALRHNFLWTRQGTCLVTFRCSRLQGLPCKTYSLNVSFPETGLMESFHSVCTENEVILGNINLRIIMNSS